MKTNLYSNKKVAKGVARTLKACDPDFSYVVAHATDKPSPSANARELEGYFCIRLYLGKDFFKFA